MKNVIGRIHSTESFGAVDGPGVRFVAFLQGCPLKCLYCHNPDSWNHSDGKTISSTELVKNICTYKNFISSGGVTLSGGEPLLQPEFCEDVINGCHENGLHIAIDTSGAIPLDLTKKCLELADLILLDIKDIDPDDCKIITGMDNKNAIETLKYCEEIHKDVWIRHVLLPQYTLKAEKLNRLGLFLKNFSCIKKVELLPYHKMGLYKWESLGLKSSIYDIEPPEKDEIENAKKILLSYNLPL